MQCRQSSWVVVTDEESAVEDLSNARSGAYGAQGSKVITGRVTNPTKYNLVNQPALQCKMAPYLATGVSHGARSSCSSGMARLGCSGARACKHAALSFLVEAIEDVSREPCASACESQQCHAVPTALDKSVSMTCPKLFARSWLVRVHVLFLCNMRSSLVTPLPLTWVARRCAEWPRSHLL